MKKIWIMLALAVCCLGGALALAQQEIGPLPVKLLLPGEWHGDEVEATDGESWLALVSEHGRYELRPVTVHIEKMRDIILDPPDEMTGKRVSIEPALDPVALIRGLEIPLEGVTVVRDEIQPFIAFEKEEPYGRLATNRIALTEDSALELESVPFPEDDRYSKLVLTYAEGKNTQVLDVGEIPVSANITAALLWAGDLDGDGYTDLLLDTSDHYNVDTLTLFLSGPAEKGRLLKKVAEWRTTGC